MKTVLVGITDLRSDAKAILDGLEDHDVTIVRHNKAIALVMLPERLERLIDRIEDLEDENAVLAARLNPDDSIPYEKVAADLGLA